MPRPRPAPISSRKQPRQARSTELVKAILEAAVQVLAKEGAHRFTTVRVAEKAGVSVGSLYQYFPNKAAILFRLQSEEWRQTAEMLQAILADKRQTPLTRLRILVHAFVRSECEEAVVRVALNDAAPLYRHAPESREAKASGVRAIRSFMRELLPNIPETTRNLSSDLVTRTLSSVAKNFSETSHSDAEVNAYADAMADMLCAYLEDLRNAGGSMIPSRASNSRKKGGG